MAADVAREQPAPEHGHGATHDAGQPPHACAEHASLDQGSAAHRSVVARPLIWLVDVYQRVRAGRPSPCRYTPSCSTYAIEALQAHGAVRGTWLAVRRLGRCQPWGGQGYDPVPVPRGRARSTSPDRSTPPDREVN